MTVGTPFGVGFDVNDLDVMATFWVALTGYRAVPDGENNVYLIADASGGFNLYLHRVAEPRVGKNRLHLEVSVADLDTAQAEVEQLGGALVHDFTGGSPDEPDVSFRVCSDPEGNLFCIGLIPLDPASAATPT